MSTSPKIVEIDKNVERGDWHLTGRIDHEFGQGDPFAAAVRATRMPMALADARLPDTPLVFVNQAFQDMTGYGREEILGRNCRFLQGPETDPATVQKIRQAIIDRQTIAIEILNYRKDGTIFWNALQMSPVFDANGEVAFFFASQVDITDKVETKELVSKQEAVIEREVNHRTREQRDALDRQRLLTHEVDHRVKNNLAMISSLIRLEGRNIENEETKAILQRIQGRVDAMSSIHQQLYAKSNGDKLAIGQYTALLARQMMASFARDDVELQLDVDEAVTIDATKAAAFGLLLNELLTNAFKHAYRDGGGVLAVSLTDTGSGVAVKVADSGPGMDMNQPRSGSIGSKLIARLVAQLGATSKIYNSGKGLTVELDFPKD